MRELHGISQGKRKETANRRETDNSAKNGRETASVNSRMKQNQEWKANRRKTGNASHSWTRLRRQGIQFRSHFLWAMNHGSISKAITVEFGSCFIPSPHGARNKQSTLKK
jgi:hypothetical protein